MKQLLVIAVALATVNAQANTARITALGNAPHLIDVQTVYTNPSDIFSLGGDYVSFESGASNNGAAVHAVNATSAKGMIVRSMGDAKMGLSLGNRSTALRSLATAQAAQAPGFLIGQQNPLELTYGAKAGDMAWAGTLVYSNHNNKVTGAEVKESTMGVRLGARTTSWDAALRIGLADTVETTAGGKYTGTMSVTASGGYNMDSLYLFGSLANAGYKWENAAAVEQAKYTRTAITVGALSKIKKDGTEVFYSAALTSTEAKNDDSTAGAAGSKTSTLTLPLAIGVEAEANSWLTLRGSVSQNLQLINNSKTTPQAGGNATVDLAPGNDNLTFGAGLGLKLNKVTVDASLFTANGAGTNTTITGDNLLANVGMSYWF